MLKRNSWTVAVWWAIGSSRPENQCQNHTGNFSFKGKVLYSYKQPIARIIPEKRCVLFSTKKWSKTTTRHRQLAINALSERNPYKVFHVEHLFKLDHQANIDDYDKRICDCIKVFRRTRNPNWLQWRLTVTKFMIDAANEYIDTFGLKVQKFKAPPDLNPCYVLHRMRKCRLEGK